MGIESKNKHRRHLWESEAKDCCADNYPSFSVLFSQCLLTPTVTNWTRGGARVSGLSRAKGRKMLMKIMISQLTPWTQFELLHLEKWETKQFFMTNFMNIQAINDGQKLITLRLWHKHSCLWIMVTMCRAQRWWGGTSCLCTGACSASASGNAERNGNGTLDKTCYFYPE